MRPRRPAASAEITASRGGHVAPPLLRLEVRVPPEWADLVGALLVEEGSGGALHDERPDEVRLTCFGEDRGALASIAGRVRQRLALAGLAASIRLGCAPRGFGSWRTAWTRDLGVVVISPTLSIVPTTSPDVDVARGVRVLLEPAMAFGFGEHPTTRMAAREVERGCRGGARCVLDFGTGSGVLAIVAALTGAARVVGLDSDAAAVAAARANAARNGVLARCRFSLSRLTRLRARFDTVVANVDRATLLDLAEALSARVEPRGALLLTGLLREDGREISRRYRELGFSVLRGTEEDGWVMLRFRKQGIRSARGASVRL